MPYKKPSFTLGIEEEYLLVDRETRELAIDPPPEVMAECEKQLDDLVKPEFMKSQIEVATQVCQDIHQARAELKKLRTTVSNITNAHGLAPIAASTHPFSEWQEQEHTDKERYNRLAENMQGVARRLLISGMHVHVAIEDEELRIDLMNQVSYFLPHLLALSTSSPFWRGDHTGLKSYRLSIFDELPRTGLPERFDSYTEFSRHVGILQKAGIIEDASMMWWDVRPSCRFPTLEMRITDVCPNIEDTLCIAAVYQSILHYLFRLRRKNQRWRIYADMLINENRWRAQRYGLDEGLIDYGEGCITPCEDLIEELIDMLTPDATELGCLKEVEHMRIILKRGTSAHRQLKTFEEEQNKGASRKEALVSVVDQLITETTDF